MTQPPQPPKKPLGAPIDWTDSELDEMSAVSSADVKAAVALWQNEAPSALRNLISAEVQGEQNDGK